MYSNTPAGTTVHGRNVRRYLWLWDGLSGVLRGDVLPIEQLDDLKALVLKPVQLGHFGCCVLGRGTLNV